MFKNEETLPIGIELNTRDLTDLLTNREVRKGSIVIKVEPFFFHGIQTDQDGVKIVKRRVDELLYGERLC